MLELSEILIIDSHQDSVKERGKSWISSGLSSSITRRKAEMSVESFGLASWQR